MSLAAVRERRETIETRFGQFALEGDDVIEMAEPLAGFETCRRYVLLSPAAIAPLVCLQGLDGTRPSVLAVPPMLADPTFTCDLALQDWHRVGLPHGPTPEAPVLWLALVHVGADEASANLRAPIVINPDTMLGLQVVPPSSAYSTVHPLPLG
jgi:flagellar assembly factor FliW